MRCVAEAPVEIAEVHDLDALPAPALALFGGDAFSTLAWYRGVAAAAVDPASRPCFQVASRDGTVLAVLPMLLHAGGLTSLTTPYTARWSPLLRDNLTQADVIALGLALGRRWRGSPATRLEAIDARDTWQVPLLRGLRRAGLVPLRFDHFGNWFLPTTGLGWEAYLSARPGELRSAVTRRTRRLMQGAGASFTLITTPDDLEAGIQAYEQVYAASWKQAEPFPDFAAALMREAAAAGELRLGLLHLDGAPIAAQIWLVHGSWAGVQKLAHDEAHRTLAPGTVLTALMLRHLLDHERIGEIDFGRGDDAYKALWTGQRRQRIGVVLAAPWRPAGLHMAARHWIGRIARGQRNRNQFQPARYASSPDSTASHA